MIYELSLKEAEMIDSFRGLPQVFQENLYRIILSFHKAENCVMSANKDASNDEEYPRSK